MRDRLTSIERKLNFMLYASLIARWVLVAGLLYLILRQDWSHGVRGVLRLIWEGQP